MNPLLALWTLDFGLVLFFILLPLLIVLWAGALLWELQHCRDWTGDRCRFCDKPISQRTPHSALRTPHSEGFCPDCAKMFRRKKLKSDQAQIVLQQEILKALKRDGAARITITHEPEVKVSIITEQSSH